MPPLYLLYKFARKKPRLEIP